MAVEQRQAGTRVPLAYVLVGAAFLLTRLPVLLVPLTITDVNIYAEYAYEQDVAAREHRSFYEVHAEMVPQHIEAVRVAALSAGSLDEYRDVEYPPLAVAAMRLPEWWMPRRPPGEGLTTAFLEDYRRAYRLAMAAVDVALFVLLLLLVRRLFGHERGPDQTLRLLVYVACTFVLWHLLYDRLDLPLAFLVVAAVALLLSRQHYAWSFGLLALAVNFKVVPVVLVPVWVVGSLPADRAADLFRPRLLAALGARAVLLAALILGCFLPFYLTNGPATLRFLGYHGGRGLEIGSVWSSLPLLMDALGQPTPVEYSYGGINVRSPASAVLAVLAPWVQAGLLLAAAVLLVLHARRLRSGDGGPPGTGATLAQVHASTFVGYTLLFLMLFVTGNKVFSPQYFVWLAPLVCLAAFPPWARRPFIWAFVLTCVLTTVVYPFLMVLDLIDRTQPQPGATWAMKGPTVRLALALGARNLLFVGLTAGLAFWLVRRARAAPGWLPAP
jgi:hypothetical protein